MENHLVSIVVPVYNGEQVLSKTMDSLCDQDYADIEIICVDDGSTDGSLSILNDYSSKDRRVSVITQKNSGAGIARNSGMRVASGKWLMFLDSDDVYSPDIVSEMVASAEFYDADSCVCEVDAVDGEGRNRRSLARFPDLFTKDSYTPAELGAWLFRFTTPAPFCKLFKADHVKANNLSFQALSNANDLFFTMSSLALSQRISLVRKPLVAYRMGGGSSIQDRYAANPSIDKCLNGYRAISALREKLLSSGNLTEDNRLSLDELSLGTSICNASKMFRDAEKLEELLKIYRTALFEEWKIDFSAIELLDRKTRLKFELMTKSSARELSWAIGGLDLDSLPSSVQKSLKIVRTLYLCGKYHCLSNIRGAKCR